MLPKVLKREREREDSLISRELDMAWLCMSKTPGHDASLSRQSCSVNWKRDSYLNPGMSLGERLLSSATSADA